VVRSERQHSRWCDSEVRCRGRARQGALFGQVFESFIDFVTEMSQWTDKPRSRRGGDIRLFALLSLNGLDAVSQARNFPRSRILMHHPLVGSADDFRLRSLKCRFRCRLVPLGDCFLDMSDESFEASAARLIDRIATGGNAGSFFCRTGVGHCSSFPLKEGLLPQTKTRPLAAYKGLVGLAGRPGL